MTLREILIALAILVVLAVVVATIFHRQRQEALRVAGSRNLQQWGIALNLYLIDNQNQLPETGVEPITAEQKTAWFNALPPYISQTALAELPAGQRPRPGVPSLWIDPASQPVKSWDPEVFYFNYGMNRALQPVAGTRSFRINEIQRPADVIFLATVAGYSPAIGPDDVVFPGGRKDTSLKAATPILFCDGHVQPVSRQELLDPAALSAGGTASGITWFQQ